MSDTFIMSKTFVIASIMKTKSVHFGEKYVTYKELNYVSSKLQKKYNEENISVCIVEEMDRLYYLYNSVILLNSLNNSSIDKIEARYTGYCPSLDILTILWDDKYILELLIELKQEELNKAKIDLEKLNN